MKKMKLRNLSIGIGKKSIFVFENGGKRRICGRTEFLAHEFDRDRENMAMRVRIWTIHGDSKTVRAIPLSLAHNGSRLIECLANHGLDVVDLHLAKQVLVDLYQRTKPQKRIEIVSQCGWHDLRGDGNFVFVDGSRLRGTSENMYVSTRAGISSNFAKLGDLEGWNRTIGKKCRGNPELQLLICAALAGPLLFHLGCDNFGFQIVGTSRKGKTRGLEVVNSVYFYPRSYHSFYGTENALAAQAHRQNDSVLLVDELGEGDATSLAKSIYHIGNGSGKARLGANMQVHKAGNFRTVFIATGEKTLSEVLADEGKTIMAGQVARLLVLRVDEKDGLFVDTHGAESGGEFVRRLKTHTRNYYGSLGAAWIDYLEQNLGQVRRTIEKSVGRVAKQIQEALALEELTSFEDSALQAMAVCAAAGEAAIDEGLLRWKKGDAVSAAVHCLRKWRAEQLCTKEATVDTAIAGLKKFLQSESDGHFASLSMHATTPRKGLAGYTHSMHGEELFLLLPAYFQTEICKKTPLKNVLTALRTRGWLVSDKGRTSKSVRLPNSVSEKQTFIAVKKAILGG